MTIQIILYNGPNSELDRVEIEDPSNGDVSKAIHTAIKDWELDVGDTIEIKEVWRS